MTVRSEGGGDRRGVTVLADEVGCVRTCGADGKGDESVAGTVASDVAGRYGLNGAVRVVKTPVGL